MPKEDEIQMLRDAGEYLQRAERGLLSGDEGGDEHAYAMIDEAVARLDTLQRRLRVRMATIATQEREP